MALITGPVWGAANGGASGNVTLAYPAPTGGILAGDILVAFITSRDNVSSSISGWTEKGAANQGTENRITVTYLRAAGGESGSVTVTHTSGGAISAVMGLWRGVIASGDPFDATLTIPTSSDAATPCDVSAVTPATNGNWLGAFFGGWKSTTTTAPSFTTLTGACTVQEVASTGFGASGNRSVLKVASDPTPPAGGASSGTSACAFSNATGTAGFHFALKPDTSGIGLQGGQPFSGWWQYASGSSSTLHTGDAGTSGAGTAVVTSGAGLVVAIVAQGSGAGTPIVTGISGAGSNWGTWNMQVRSNARQGGNDDIEIWTNVTTGAVNGVVTATFDTSGNVASASIRVFCFDSGASTAIGNTGSNSGATASVSCTVNTVAQDSLVLFGCTNWTNANAPTAYSPTPIADWAHTMSTNGNAFGQALTAPRSAGNITVSCTETSCTDWDAVGIEIKASGGTTYNDSLTEAAGAADALTTSATMPNALTEAGNAADSLSAGLVLFVTVTEAASAADALSNTQIFAESLAEAAATSDALATSATMVNSLTEAAAAVDALVTTSVMPNAISEAASAADAIVGGMLYVNSISEAASAADVLATAATWNNALNEAASAADALATTATMSNTLTEPANAADTLVDTLGAGTTPPPSRWRPARAKTGTFIPWWKRPTMRGPRRS